MEEIPMTTCIQEESASARPGGAHEADVLRRCRLAEVLFLSVLQAPDGPPVRRAACAFERALDPAITEAICSFLGHPRACPHGEPIPPGTCCRALSRPSRPLVEPLSRLAPGCDADVVFVVAADPRRIARLAALGLAPGARVHVLQTAPAAVVRIGHTTVAFENATADDIYVRRPVWPPDARAEEDREP
jgi:DtxR family transcriptional regulator, Mn-dependent transcriptional regulator